MLLLLIQRKFAKISNSSSEWIYNLPDADNVGGTAQNSLSAGAVRVLHACNMEFLMHGCWNGSVHLVFGVSSMSCREELCWELFGNIIISVLIIYNVISIPSSSFSASALVSAFSCTHAVSLLHSLFHSTSKYKKERTKTNNRREHNFFEFPSSCPHKVYSSLLLSYRAAVVLCTATANSLCKV